MSTTININLDVAMEQFKKRKAANEGKKIDNSSLYAGSPMYFYCKFCEENTDVLPESYFRQPKTICNPCEILHAHGLI